MEIVGSNKYWLAHPRYLPLNQRHGIKGPWRYSAPTVFKIPTRVVSALSSYYNFSASCEVHSRHSTIPHRGLSSDWVPITIESGTDLEDMQNGRHVQEETRLGKMPDRTYPRETLVHSAHGDSNVWGAVSDQIISTFYPNRTQWSPDRERPDLVCRRE